MIVCPNCSHQNPDGAQACEACFTPLPATTACPYCGAPVQTDASFCGQCGSGLKPSSTPNVAEKLVTSSLPEPVISQGDLPKPINSTSLPDQEGSSVIPATVVSQQNETPASSTSLPDQEGSSVIPALAVSPPPETPAGITPPPAIEPSFQAKTQLQQQFARLLHIQTNTTIELPQNLSVIHIGKPNDQIPPDIDVSGFPNSEVVSRIHADVRLEGDAYYIEDVGSSNGTYVNHNPLLPGNRHRLRPGDRIALGKGDLVTFLFQLS